MPAAQIQARVRPKAGRNAIDVLDENTVRILVTAPPDGGKANDAIIGLLAKRLGVGRGNVRIQRGHKSRNKLLQIDGITQAELLRRLSKGDQ